MIRTNALEIVFAYFSAFIRADKLLLGVSVTIETSLRTDSSMIVVEKFLGLSHNANRGKMIRNSISENKKVWQLFSKSFDRLERAALCV